MSWGRCGPYFQVPEGARKDTYMKLVRARVNVCLLFSLVLVHCKGKEQSIVGKGGAATATATVFIISGGGTHLHCHVQRDVLVGRYNSGERVERRNSDK